MPPAQRARAAKALEAARGAALAVHAAAGLSSGVEREAARLLRAAEGIVRAAVACLASAPDPIPTAATEAEAAAAPRRRRRPRGRRGRTAEEPREEGDAAMPLDAEPGGADDAAMGLEVASAASEASAGSLPDDAWADAVPGRAAPSLAESTPDAVVPPSREAGGTRALTPFAPGDRFRAVRGFLVGAVGLVEEVGDEAVHTIIFRRSVPAAARRMFGIVGEDGTCEWAFPPGDIRLEGDTGG